MGEQKNTRTGWPRIIKSGPVQVRVYRMKHETNASGWAYVLCWNSPSGRKRIKFANEAAALDEAKLKADQLAAGKIAGADISVQDRDLLLAAQKRVGDIPLMSALDEWAKARELAGGHLLAAAKAWNDANQGKIEEVLLKDAVKRFLAACRRRGVNTKAGLERSLPDLTTKFGEMPIATVSANALQIWMHERYPNPSSLNSHRKRFVQFWRWCRDKGGMLPQAIRTEAERTDRVKEPELEIGILTPREFAQALLLIKTEHPEHLAATVIAGFCGLRRKEIHGQMWDDVLLNRGFLRVTTAKANTPSKRLVPIPPAACEWLLTCSKPEKDKPQLVSPPFGVDRLRKFIRNADPPINCPENAFRHSFISYRVAHTGKVEETALEAGNSRETIFQHYRELVTKDDAVLWFGMTIKAAERIVGFDVEEMVPGKGEEEAAS